jgi:L,D-transpeptidase catalytic domain
MRFGQLLTVVMLLAAIVSAQAEIAHASTGTRTILLSNELTFTRSAGPLTTALVRPQPSRNARPFARLRLLTEEGRPEIYLLLREQIASDGEAWIDLRLSGRPNGRTGWVPATALWPSHLTHWALRVELQRLRAVLMYRGRRVWSAPVGIGAPATPTPRGHFVTRELLRVPGHTLYGPYAFGTSDYSTLADWPNGGVVGIHGTNEPWLIPGRPSHGCIRMRNADIAYLAHHLPLGAPVDVV